MRRAKRNSKQEHRATPPSDEAPTADDTADAAAAAAPSRRALLVSLAAALGSGAIDASSSSSLRAVAMSNGVVSDAWASISGAPSDLTFPDEFMGTWLCYSSLTRVDTPQGDDLVQDVAVVNRARADVGGQIVYPMRFIRNNQGRVVMDRVREM